MNANEDMNEEIEVEEADIETLVSQGQKVPKAKQYRIRIDKAHYVTDNGTPTGKEILGLAGKSSDSWLLYQILRGRQPEPVEPNGRVDLRFQGIERFTTVQRDPTEGLVQSPRREFGLPENDDEFLNSLGKEWEAANDGGTHTLLIPGWTVPPGYNHGKVTLALLLPPGYPDTQIDMVYFNPHLVRTDGKGIGALATHPIFGQAFQRWSRHRTGANPWRPGVDDISTHLALVDDWLRREFKLR